MSPKSTVRANPLRSMDWIILGLMAFLTHQTLFICFENLDITRTCQYGSATLQLVVLAAIAIGVFWLLRLSGAVPAYVAAWRRNIPLAVFVGLALCSLAWTVFLPATLYRALVLLFVSLVTAYLGIRLSARDLVVFIAVMVGVFAWLSLFLVVIAPHLAIMWNYPYEGLWRGIFRHKIYLGATMALGYVAYLVIVFSARSEYSRLSKILAAITLPVCVALAIQSDSASGLIVLAIQTGIFGVLLAWLAWGHRLSRRAYWVLAGLGGAALVLAIANLEFLFGLFNRSANMTGRVPLWMHLWHTYIVDRPVLGHGFGAFWLQPGMNEQIQSVVGWPYPVRVSDDGYFDVLLGLGFVGLGLLLLILATGFWRSLPRAVAGRSLTAFFPVFMLVHILFINISLSYLIEIEFFIWFLLVLIVFMDSPRPSESTTTTT